MAAPRNAKLADQIKVVIAQTLERRVKDPRLGFLTLTEVRLSGDNREATVFYTVLGTPEDVTSTAAALESAKGLLRSEVGKRTGVKLTPTLTFQLDHTPQTAADIAEALRIAAVRDAEVAALAAGARYAGDADPYKKPAIEDEAQAPSEADAASQDEADAAAEPKEDV